MLGSFGWWSWRLNALSNLNSLAPEVRPVVATVVAGEISFRRLGSQRHGQTTRVDRVLGPAGSPSPVPARAERPAGVPARPAGAAVGGGSRSYLVVYLDSLLIGELPDQVPEATWSHSCPIHRSTARRGLDRPTPGRSSRPSAHSVSCWPNGAPLAVPGLVKRWQSKLGTCAGVGDPKPLELRLGQSRSG